MTPHLDGHRCQPVDDAEVTTRNLAAFARFANPTLLPPFPPHRTVALQRILNVLYGVFIPTQRTGPPADLRPRSAPAVEHQRAQQERLRSSREGRGH